MFLLVTTFFGHTVVFIVIIHRVYISIDHRLNVDSADLYLVCAFEHAFKERSSHLFACVVHHNRCKVLQHVILVRFASRQVLGEELAKVVEDAVSERSHLAIDVLILLRADTVAAMDTLGGVVHLLEDHIDKKLDFVEREQLRHEFVD